MSHSLEKKGNTHWQSANIVLLDVLESTYLPDSHPEQIQVDSLLSGKLQLRMRFANKSRSLDSLVNYLMLCSSTMELNVTTSYSPTQVVVTILIP